MEQNMKKTAMLLSCLLILSVSIPTLTSCSGRAGQETETDNTNESTIESATINLGEHLATEAKTEIITETEAITETEEQTTEKQTEAPTERPTEKPTEKPTEAPTERETEPAPSLKYVTFDNGTCSVSGIGDIKDAYVIIPEKSPAGDVVIAIEDKAFFENSTMKAIQIPSTVMSIGELAFGGCSSLVYVSVDAQNRAYTDVDGILYTKDKTKIILLPCANPTAEIFISVAVKEISAMAFYNTSSLKSIKYGGTLSDWNKIKIGDKNYGIYSASLSFAVTE